MIDFTYADYQQREGQRSNVIYARISYSLEIANPITITVYPVTYDHYENVLGRSLPPSFLPREPGTEYEACGKYTCIPHTNPMGVS